MIKVNLSIRRGVLSTSSAYARNYFKLRCAGTVVRFQRSTLALMMVPYAVLATQDVFVTKPNGDNHE